MSTLKEDITRAVIAIHRETKEEWIPLKEIYAKVEELRMRPNANKGASIRASLEIHSPQSDAFEGKQLYNLKEKGTGLYQSMYYNQLMKIETLNIGELFTRDEVMELFKVSGQSEMLESNTLDALVLITSLDNGIYGDSEIENGKIIYTGEGKVGNQQLNKNNETLYHSLETNLSVYLFTKDSQRRYTYEGKVKLYDKPYMSDEVDINGNMRKVWKFPLQILYSNQNQNEEIDANVEAIARKVEVLEEAVKVSENDVELVFVDGPLKIRKYRPDSERGTGNRRRRPNYIARAIVNNKQGEINEEVIYKNELKYFMDMGRDDLVKRMKDFFENRKDDEGYDILSFELNNNQEYIEKYIEVKSTKGNESTPIDITDSEVRFAKKHLDQYYLYRIIKSDSRDRYVKIVKGKDLICDYEFVPNTYQIYSK